MKTRVWMNKASKGAMSALATLALMVTASNVASACWYVMGQDELPEKTKSLRKF